MYNNKVFFSIFLSIFACLTGVFAQSVSIDFDNITPRCEGNIELTTQINDPGSVLTTPITYEWSAVFNNTPSDLLNNADDNPAQGTGVGENFSTIDISLEPGVYMFTVTLNGMPAFTNTIGPITVEAAPAISAGVGDVVSQCINSIDEIDLFSFLSVGAIMDGVWVDQEGQTITDGLIENPTVNDSGRYTYTVTSNIAGACNGFSVSANIDLILTEEQEIILDPSLEVVCEAEPILINSNLSDADFTFQWFFDDNDNVNDPIPLTGETQPFLQGSRESGTYYVEYTGNTPGACTVRSTDAIVVNVGPPENLQLTLGEGSFSNDNSIIATFDGDPNGLYVFSLDTGEPQESNIFENVSPGNHVVSVTDLNGCGFDDAQINVFGLPQFFSPNGDGINETWNIELDPSNPMTVTIFVFDRFGKLLAQVFPGGTGWDGTFGGKNLPSDDYWFSVTVEETGEVTTGHFTLIR